MITFIWIACAVIAIVFGLPFLFPIPAAERAADLREHGRTDAEGGPARTLP